MAAGDALPIPRKNVAYRVTFPILDADGDLVTGAASLDSEVSKDGGTFADCTNEATEIATSSGIYFLDLTATEMNADCVVVIVKTATAGAKTTPIVLYPEEVGDVRVTVEQWRGTQPSVLIAGRVDANAQVVGDKTGYALTTAEHDAIVDKVWDELLSGHSAAGSFGRRLQVVRDGTAQAGAAGSITLDASASATDDIYNDHIVYVVSGTGAGQARRISDYVGSTKVASVVPNWQTAPDATSVFLLLPSARADLALWLGVAVNALVSGRVDAQVGAYAAGQAPADSVLVTPANKLATEADGMAHADLKEWLGVAPLALTTQKVQAKDADAAQASVCTETRLSELDAATGGKMAAEVDILKEASVIRRATAQAGAASTITLDASASAVDDFYNEAWVIIAAGTGIGQVRVITDYVGSTKVATITPNWSTNPDATSVFIVLPSARADGISAGATDWSAAEKQQIRQALGIDGTKTATSAGNLDSVKAKTDSLTFTGAGKVDASVRDWLGTPPNALVTGRVDASAGAMAAGVITAAAFAANAIDAAAIAANAIGASELAADAVTEIRDGILQATLAELAQAAPPATPQVQQALMLLYMALRNKVTQSATELKLHNDVGTVIAKSAVSDDGTTFTRDELATGP